MIFSAPSSGGRTPFTPPTPKIAGFELSDADHGTVLEIDSETGVSVTIPAGLTEGFWCQLVQKGVGSIVVSATGGATVQAADGANGTATQYAVARIDCIGTDEYVLSGLITLASL